MKKNQKKKCAIITIFDPKPNYGNRLQNYATYKILSNMNFNVTTLHVEKQYASFKNNIKKFVQSITRYSFTNNKNYWKYDYVKIQKFDRFNKKYIPNKEIKLFNGLAEEYDYFAIGSDQVWNPTWYDELRKQAYLLTFAKPNQKICLSPSFGISNLPIEWENTFKEALNNFSTISVREEEGAKIIKKLTGKDAQILIDPTLMLSRFEWIKVQKKPSKINFDKEYILTYFLGGKTKDQEEYIYKISKKNNLIVYNLLDYMQPELYVTDPGEFLYLINNAKIIFTDSFHACVFSFIFGKPFEVFSRNGTEKNMMSRITTLLNTLSLQRKLHGYAENDLFECDYSEGFKQLEKEQNKVSEFLLNYCYKY